MDEANPFHVIKNLRSAAEDHNPIVQTNLGYVDKVAGKVIIRIFRESASDYARQVVDRCNRLAHPNIIRLLQCQSIGAQLALVFEHAAGKSLFARIRSLKLGQRRSICCGLVRALAFLHKNGIAHGRVTQRNVLLNEDCSVALLDVVSSSFLREGSFEGDVEAVGKILREVLGERCVNAEDWLKVLLCSCSRKVPQERPTMDRVTLALDAHWGGSLEGDCFRRLTVEVARRERLWRRGAAFSGRGQITIGAVTEMSLANRELGVELRGTLMMDRQSIAYSGRFISSEDWAGGRWVLTVSVGDLAQCAIVHGDSPEFQLSFPVLADWGGRQLAVDVHCQCLESIERGPYLICPVTLQDFSASIASARAKQLAKEMRLVGPREENERLEREINNTWQKILDTLAARDKLASRLAAERLRLEGEERGLQARLAVIKDVAKTLNQRDEGSFVQMKEKVCVQCDKDMDAGGVVLPCGHLLHLACLSQLAKPNPTCPCCRGPIAQQLLGKSQDP